jgi:beta-galactosidase/beta-glucuronidase
MNCWSALRIRCVAAKQLGFNLLRKHAKVEPERWYYWTDKLGMLVWRDMPQCFDREGPNHQRLMSDAAKAQWLVEWKHILAQRMNHPSIIVWTTFNEAMGQHDTQSIVALTKQIDPSRLVNAASGWNDKKVGDIHDIHQYPGPWCELPEPDRASVNGEFGGLTMRVPGHMWTTDVMGYGKMIKSGWALTQKYQNLLQTAYRLRNDPGASAFVYTQLTDVEQELSSDGWGAGDRCGHLAG